MEALDFGMYSRGFLKEQLFSMKWPIEREPEASRIENDNILASCSDKNIKSEQWLLH